MTLRHHHARGHRLQATAAAPTRRLRLTIYVIGALVWSSGVLWWLFDRYMKRPSEFGPVPHPLEPQLLRLHAAAAFAAIGLFGYLYAAHMERAWPTHQRRGSGLGFVCAYLWLVVSGYLLYYIGAEQARAVVSDLHWIVGLAVPLFLIQHRRHTGSRSLRRQQRSPP